MVAGTDDRLLSQLEAGGTVLTVNSRLARFLRRSYDLRQQAAGRLAWTTPDILSLDAWLRRCWNDAFDVNALSLPDGGATKPSPQPKTRRTTRRAVAVPADATDDLFGAALSLPEESSPADHDIHDVPPAGLQTRPPASPLPTLLCGQHEQVLWEKIIAESHHGHALLQIGATARTARQAWGLLRQWQMLPDDLVSPLPDDAYAFRDWAREFLDLCTRRQWADEASLPDLVAGFFRDGILPSPVSLSAVGFDEPSPQLRALFDAARCERAEAPEAPMPRHAVRLPFPEAATELEAAARWTRGLLEAFHASRAAASPNGSGDGSGPGFGAAPAIAVVVPDLAERRATVERVFADILHPSSVLPPCTASPSEPLYNISLGHSLAEVPLVRAALLALELAGGHDVSVEAVSSALRSPFFAGSPEEHTCRAIVDAQLRRQGHLTTRLSTIHRIARRLGPGRCPRLRKGLAALRLRQRASAARRADFRSPAAWAREFADTLRDLGWPDGRTLDSAEYQARRRWHDLLEQLESLDSVLDPSDGEPKTERRGRNPESRTHSPELIPRGAALARLRQFAAEAVFQPEGPGDAPVQILGLLEASAGMTYDHLWIVGLHDEAWPGPAHPNPFLPVDLQRRAAMPHASPEWELAFASRATERLLVSAPDTVISYPERDGDRDLRPSPLVAHLPEGTGHGGEGNGAMEFPRSSVPLLCDHLFAARASEVVEEIPHVPVVSGELDRLRGGTRIFTDQAACSFRAFARHRLGARGLERCTAGPAPADRGVMVHRALERLWGELGGSEALRALTHGELGRIAFRAARGAVAEAFRDPDSRLARLETDRLRRLLLDWLEVERKRPPFTVVLRESRRAVQFGALSVETIIDRVDRLDDGSLVIIDYKTSRPNVRDWFGERPTEPQLPIYCASSDESPAGCAPGEESSSRVAAVAFAQFRAGDMRFQGVARTTSPVLPDVKHYSERDEAATFETWEDLVAAWGRELNSLARTFAAGRIRVEPKEGRETCSRCDLGPLCRVHELAARAADEDGESGEGGKE